MPEYNEHRVIAILQAAEENDPSLVPDMTEEERKQFDDYVKEFDMLRKMNGGTLKGLDIDIPYD